MNYKTIINLTKNTFYARDITGKVHEIPPSGHTAWVKSFPESRGTVNVGGAVFNLVEPFEDHVIGLPEPVDGVLFIVTGIVAEYVTRPDVVAPGNIITDDRGRRVAHAFCLFTSEEGGVA